jgi:ABC-type transporter Mla MlaB component
MPRKKKTQQHIGHDPLAWLAEGENNAPEQPAAPEAASLTADSAEECATEEETPVVAHSEMTEPMEAVTAVTDTTPESELKATEVEEETTAALTASSTTGAADNPEPEMMPVAETQASVETEAAEFETYDIAPDETASAVEQQQTLASEAVAAADVTDTVPAIAEAERAEEEEESDEAVSNAETTMVPLGWHTVTLPAVLTLTELPSLYEELNNLLGQRIRLSGGQITRIDTAGLQLLVALMADEDTTIGWLDASETLCQSAYILGLNQALNLAEFETVETAEI